MHNAPPALACAALPEHTALGDVSRVVMAKRVIRVTGLSAADWVVREEGGRDLGH
jgi:hypothetical protein